MERKLTVILAGDDRSLSSTVKGASGTVDGFGSKVGGLSTTAKVAFAGAAAGAVTFGKSALDAGSDLDESWSKMRTVFGSASADVEAFAKSGDKIGLTDRAAADALGTFGNMFDQLGIGSDVSAGMSKSMVTLAADLGSFHNADISEVIDAQSSAFRGEYDALQKFIPTINAAAVEQRALELSGKDTTDALTDQDKALAVQKLMMEGAGKATGDFARTSDGAANQQRVMTAKFGDLQAMVGQKLLPILSKLLTWGLDFGDWLGRHKPALVGFAAIVGTGLVVAFLAWASSAAAAAAATLVAMAPVIAITAAVAALVAGVIWAYNNWDLFRDAVDKVARFFTGTLWPALQSVAGWITGTLVPTVGRIIGVFGEWIGKAGQVASDIKGKFNDLVGWFRGIPGSIGAAMSGLADTITRPFRSAFDGIKRLWNNTIGGFGFTVGGWDPPGPGPKVPGFSFRIPSMAEGGIVKAQPGGILANIGEGRFDEAVIPLDGKNHLAPAPAAGPMTVNLQLPDGRTLFSWVLDMADEYGTSNGRVLGVG